MTKSSNLYVGMDVHKDSIDIALADEEGRPEVRHYGSISGDLATLDQAVRKLQATGKTLHFVYEAGPCGYVIYRHLAGKDLDCVVVAPSMIPKRSGDRVKTDRRDAEMLARLHRAGELSAVYVPHPEDEAVRVRIPAQTGQRFQPNLDSNSKANWTLIPAQPGQPKVIT